MNEMLDFIQGKASRETLMLVYTNVCLYTYISVSINGGTPKWMVYKGKPY